MQAHEVQWEKEISRIEGMKTKLSQTLEAQQAKITELEAKATQVTTCGNDEVRALQV